VTMPVAAKLTGLTVDIATRQSRNPPVVRVLDAADLCVQEGRITALIGESGCGKSLVAAALCGLLPPGSRVRGGIAIDGENVTDADERRWRKLRGSRIGFVPQSAATSFTPVRTIGSQLAEVCRRLHADRTVDDLLSAVRLSGDTGARYPHEMSGGMAQRAAIAAAVAARPKLLVADEPTSALDPDNAAMVWQLLADAAADGAGVLVITHELSSLLRAGVCDDIALMRAGTIVSQGPAATMPASPDGYVRRFFAAAIA
jgi:peptide/nickel transport system ATP-binding protein